jgi:hypothetical protein
MTIANDIIAYAKLNKLWGISGLVNSTLWCLWMNDRVLEGDFTIRELDFNGRDIILIGMDSKTFVIDLEVFEEAYKKLKKSSNPKKPSVGKEIRSSKKFEDWAKKFLIAGDIVKLTGVKGNPIRKITKVHEYGVGFIENEQINDAFVGNGQHARNMIRNIVRIYNTKAKTFVPITDLYKDICE